MHKGWTTVPAFVLICRPILFSQMNIATLYNYFLSSGQVTTDSRHCPAGSIFFALRGERFNGNNYARQALEAGCSLAVVDDASLRDTPGCYHVDDALAALQQLSTHHRKETGAKIIGITGSNGKTTTKELAYRVLSKKYKTWYTRGNLNNHVGVPLTLLAMPVGTEMGVIEMGANHLNEIAMLCKICQPDHGLITNVGKAHIEGFGSFEGVKTAKSELYTYLKQAGGAIFVNGDNPNLAEMLGAYSGFVYRYGVKIDFEITCRAAKADPFLAFEWKSSNATWQELQTNLTGLYNLENALAAISIGTYFGVQASDINYAISNYQPDNHRSQLTRTRTNTVVLDAYNANPSSMAAALENFNTMQGHKKVVILGGMKELGADSFKEHENIVAQVIATGILACYLVGEEFEGHIPPDKSGFKWFESTDELIEFFKSNPVRESLLLVKGSRANKLERIIELL